MIVYGSSGVCRVDAVGPLQRAGPDPERAYYTLSPMFSSGVVYTPVDTSVFMRPVLSQSEVETLIDHLFTTLNLYTIVRPPSTTII